MYSLARYIGHRGLAGLAPENTLPSIRFAQQYGFRWIEIDTRPTKDGIAMLSHDDSLSRCGNRGRLSRLIAQTAAKRTVPAGRVEFADARVPYLEEVLTVAKMASTGVVVEIKANQNEEKKSAEAAMAAITASGGECIVASFNIVVLQHVRQNMPHLPLAWNISHPLDWKTPCRDLNMQNIHIQNNRFSKKDIAAFKANNLGVYCFTVNDKTQQQALLAAGVDGVFTDFPQPN